MDCSDGAKMLIDQMKEHPEEFRGYAGKFTNMLDMAREANQGLQRNVKMSARDAEAILAAAETHLYEVWLAEDVLTAIMLPKQEAEPNKVYATPVKAGLGQMTGAHIANNTWGSSYEDHMREMERAKYKMEMEKLRQLDNEYAMRNTKPFKPFL